VKLVIQRNLLRRNLTTSQRAAIGVEIKALYSKDAEQRMTAGKAPDPSANLREGKASEEAAKLVKVSPRSIEAAEKVKRKSPVLFKKVANGEMSVNEAVHSLPQQGGSKPEPSPRHAAPKDKPVVVLYDDLKDVKEQLRFYAHNSYPNIALFHLWDHETFQLRRTGWCQYEVLFIVLGAEEKVIEAAGIPVCRSTTRLLSLSLHGSVPAPAVVPSQLIVGGLEGVMNALAQAWPTARKILVSNREQPPIGWELLNELGLFESVRSKEAKTASAKVEAARKLEDGTLPEDSADESAVRTCADPAPVQQSPVESESEPTTPQPNSNDDAAPSSKGKRDRKRKKRSSKSSDQDSITGAEDVISALSLRRRFGAHYETVLEERLEEIDADGQREFKTLQPLPTKEEYEGLQRKAFTSSVQSLVEDAFATFESLRDEYQEWRDNLPESLQDSAKASDLEDAIQQLEELGEPDLPPWADDMPVFHLPSIAISSRPKRLNEATQAIQDCITEIETLIDSGDYRSLEEEDEEINADSLRELADSLQSKVEDAENVPLPGMF
jgi:hypothetical protein